MAPTFEDATKYVAALPAEPKMDDETRLKFYGLYKQATLGDCTGSRPWSVQFEACAKYDEWKKHVGMSQDDAKKKYIEFLTSVRPEWQHK
jgi:diazepam-binding inhibitor (GABA receptor modulating acyl-CoA-binding protein)